MRCLGLASRSSGRIGVAIPAILVLTLGCTRGSDAPGDTASAGGAPAAAPGSSADADLRDVSQYELTMDKMDKYFAATRNMGLAMKDMTPEQRERLKNSGGGDANTSLDDYAALMEREPVARDAISRAGLSTREFALLTMAYLQAGMADAVLQMRPDIKNADSIAHEMKANPANIRFVRDNKTVLETKFKALEAEMKAAGVDQ
jgi:hypothetical protein